MVHGRMVHLPHLGSCAVVCRCWIWWQTQKPSISMCGYLVFKFRVNHPHYHTF